MLANTPGPAGFISAGVAILTGLANVRKILQVKEPPKPVTIRKFAGGVIGLDGAGTETSDSIQARLSKGESVVTAKATRVFAPVLADMERAVGNQPNFQLGNRRFASGLIGQFSPQAIGFDSEKVIRETIQSVARIPVVVSERDITETQQSVRQIKVTGDL
jgi:hypothetical protein